MGAQRTRLDFLSSVRNHLISTFARFKSEEQVLDKLPDPTIPEICDTMQESDQETQEIEEDEVSEDDEYHFKRAATVKYCQKVGN